MFVTHYKNAVLARALRPVALGAAILCFGLTSGLSGVSFAGVAESSLPQTLPDGGPNLTEAWMRTGGARLYWNTLTQPRQIRMVGAAFADPAAVPELMSSPQGQPDAKSTGKGSRGGKAAPHSVAVDPRAPVRPWPHATARPAKQGGTTAVQAGKKNEAGQAVRSPAEKPASVSPALTAPSSARQGNGAAATPPSVPEKNGTRGNGQANGGKTQNNAAYPSSSPSIGIGNGVSTPAGAAMPSNVPAAAAPAAASSSASTSAKSSSLSVTGSGAAAGAFGKAGVGSVRTSNGGAQADVPAPPPIPSLTADDLLPPSNGAGGASGGGGAPVRAPLP